MSWPNCIRLHGSLKKCVPQACRREGMDHPVPGSESRLHVCLSGAVMGMESRVVSWLGKLSTAPSYCFIQL